jgi:tetratricopeptide (TPR) repeat protein
MERVCLPIAGLDSIKETLPQWEEMATLWKTLSDAEEPTVKIDCGIRLFQDELRRHASEVQGRISGNWFLLPENTTFPSAEQKQILLKAVELIPQLKSADAQAVRLAQFAALFYQIHDQANGNSSLEAAVKASEAAAQKNIAATVYLSLAQTLHEAGEPERSEKMFAQAVTEAENIRSEEGSKKIDILLDKRMKDRILAEICRGQAEIGLFAEAMQTAKKISEKFFVDRLCKTMGYLQINQRTYTEAEATFKNIKDPRWKSSCLNDALFRRRWDVLAL